MIKILGQNISLLQLQWIFWLFVAVLTFGAYLQDAEPLKSFIFAIVKTLATVIIIYGNIFLLIPNLYQRGKTIAYFFSVIAMLLLLCLFRIQFKYFILNNLYPEDVKPYSFIKEFTDLLIISLVTIFFSFVFRLAFDYFNMRRQQELLQQRTTEAELNLLKAQVQPHFLFNTLNNIYYVAQRESPGTALLLEKLSNIMRYFVDEAPRKEIFLGAEINFIRDYIDLEVMRMRHPLQLDIQTDENLSQLSVPPMLLIPLVENVFKHGINKRGDDNILFFCIRKQMDSLHIEVQNRLFKPVSNHKPGNGLENLRARLQLLFGHKSQLRVLKKENNFIAQLNIPL